MRNHSQTNELVARLGFDAILIAVALIGPWWLVLAAGVITAFVLPYYVEFIGIAFFLDALYAAHALSAPLPWLTFLASGVVIAAIILRRVLRFYESDPSPIL